MGCGCDRKIKASAEFSPKCNRCKLSECCCSKSASLPPCDDKRCKKICFGHWGPPKCKCDADKIHFDECDFDKIPTGSIYFGWEMTPYGAVRSLATDECYNMIGIIFQVKVKRQIVETSRDKCGCEQKKCVKCYTKEPYVFLARYGCQAQLISLAELTRDPIVLRQAVRQLKSTVNKCVDRKRVQYLYCLYKEYDSCAYERDGAAIFRNIFGLSVHNPNFESFTDVKLTYTMLFRAALLDDNGCCKDECKACCESESAGGCTRLTCESKPWKDKCCESSSSCSKCEVDCYQASKATISEFLRDDKDGCLDLRWYACLATLYTKCSTRNRDASINAAFDRDGPRLLCQLRALVDCWSSGRDLPCEDKCKRDLCDDDHEKKCTVEPCEGRNALNALDRIYSLISGINYAGLPTPLPTELDGNELIQYFNVIHAVLSTVSCECNNGGYQNVSDYSRTITTTFVAPPVVPVFPTPRKGCDDSCSLGKNAIESLDLNYC